MLTVRKKFNTLKETSERHTLTGKCENFVIAHIEAAAKCLPTKPNQTKSQI